MNESHIVKIDLQAMSVRRDKAFEKARTAITQREKQNSLELYWNIDLKLKLLLIQKQPKSNFRPIYS